MEGPTVDGDWQSDLERWLAPFVAALRHKTRARLCPAHVAGPIGPGDRKSVQPAIPVIGPGRATVRMAMLLGGKDEEIFPLLFACARACVDEDRADVIVLGSTTMHEAHGYLASRLEVPVINRGPLSSKLAESALDLGRSHSPAAWPPSAAPRHDLIRALGAAAEKSGA